MEEGSERLLLLLLLLLRAWRETTTETTFLGPVRLPSPSTRKREEIFLEKIPRKDASLDSPPYFAFRSKGKFLSTLILLG